MTRQELNNVALSLVDKYDEEKDFLIAQLDYRGHLWDLILTKQGALTHPYESKRVYFTPYDHDSFKVGCITKVWLIRDYRIANLVLNEGIDLLEEDIKLQLLPLYNAEHVNESIKEQEKEERSSEVINKYGLI